VSYLIVTSLQIFHSVPVEKLLQLVNSWQRYRQKFGGTFFYASQCTKTVIRSQKRNSSSKDNSNDAVILTIHRSEMCVGSSKCQ